MNIGDVAAETGLPPKTLRYYEEIGLVTPGRNDNGYRRYSAVDVHNLAFLGRARALGFSIGDCRTLLALWQDRDRASGDVRAVAKEHLDEIDRKIADLSALRDTLRDLVARCAGDDRPDCPILTGIAGTDG